MSAKLDYTGKRVVVTGCASGIGQAAAQLLHEAGAEIVGVDIKEPSVQVKEYVPADLSDRASIDAAAATIGAGVDCLFNCAGLPNGPSGQLVFAVNFLGLRHLTEQVITGMSSGGSVVSVASVAGLMYQIRIPTIQEIVKLTDYDEATSWATSHDDLVADGYAFGKECIIVWTAQRSYELAGKGIRMNSISPGPTDTPMMPHFVEAVGADFMANFPKPLGRNSTPQEQAWPLVFLNSDAASYITGHNLMVDGGFTSGLLTGNIDPTVLMPPMQ